MSAKYQFYYIQKLLEKKEVFQIFHKKLGFVFPNEKRTSGVREWNGDPVEVLFFDKRDYLNAIILLSTLICKDNLIFSICVCKINMFML